MFGCTSRLLSSPHTIVWKNRKPVPVRFNARYKHARGTPRDKPRMGVVYVCIYRAQSSCYKFASTPKVHP